MRAFAIVNRIPPDSVLPEDLELLAQAGSEENPEYQVEVDLRQANLALIASLKKRSDRGLQDGKSK